MLLSILFFRSFALFLPIIFISIIRRFDALWFTLEHDTPCKSIVNYVHLSSPYHHATWSSSLAHWPTPIDNRRWQWHLQWSTTNTCNGHQQPAAADGVMDILANQFINFVCKRFTILFISSYIIISLFQSHCICYSWWLLIFIARRSAARHRWIRCLVCFLFLFLFCS